MRSKVFLIENESPPATFNRMVSNLKMESGTLILVVVVSDVMPQLTTKNV